MQTKLLTGKEILDSINREIGLASSEQIADIAGTLGLYNIIDIDSIQDIFEVEIDE